MTDDPDLMQLLADSVAEAQARNRRLEPPPTIEITVTGIPANETEEPTVRPLLTTIAENLAYRCANYPTANYNLDTIHLRQPTTLETFNQTRTIYARAQLT